MTRNEIIIDAIVVINDTQSLMEMPEFAKVNREDVVQIHKQIRQLKNLVYNKIKDNLGIEEPECTECPNELCTISDLQNIGDDNEYQVCNSCGFTVFNSTRKEVAQ